MARASGAGPRDARPLIARLRNRHPEPKLPRYYSELTGINLAYRDNTAEASYYRERCVNRDSAAASVVIWSR